MHVSLNLCYRCEEARSHQFFTNDITNTVIPECSCFLLDHRGQCAHQVVYLQQSRVIKLCMFGWSAWYQAEEWWYHIAESLVGEKFHING